jgi:serine protease inhibitor
MKRLVVFSIALVLILANCQKSEVPSSEIKIDAAFSTKTSNFAFDFWKTFQKNESIDKNYFISPLSLHIALGMLLNGADTQTKTEIQKVLGFENENMDSINSTYLELIEKLPEVDPKVINTIANSVWQEKSFLPEKDFINTLETQFKARLYVESFSSPATLTKINQWASDNTNGKIKKILEEISPSQVMFLVNALYFKGDWTNQFDAKTTRKADFFGTKGTTVVSMMNKNEKLKYVDMPDYQLVELPYGNEKYVMHVLLPKKLSVEETVKNLDNEKWKAALSKLTSTKIILELPKFTIEYSKKLNEILIQMGMKKAFTNEADLSKIVKPAGRLKVDFVKQDTYVAVDEKGTEAAAVTTIGIEVTSLPVYPEVICNKPFAFMISEKTSNTILYLGKVSNL